MVHIYYQNVNRIRSKLSQFYMNVLNSNFDIICLTETNLNKGVFDGEIIDGRYNIFRRDRENTCSKKREGGSVLIAIQKRYKVIRQAHWDSCMEDIWITQYYLIMIKPLILIFAFVTCPPILSALIWIYFLLIVKTLSLIIILKMIFCS